MDDESANIILSHYHGPLRLTISGTTVNAIRAFYNDRAGDILDAMINAYGRVMYKTQRYTNRLRNIIEVIPIVEEALDRIYTRASHGKDRASRLVNKMRSTMIANVRVVLDEFISQFVEDLSNVYVLARAFVEHGYNDVGLVSRILHDDDVYVVLRPLIKRVDDLSSLYERKTLRTNLLNLSHRYVQRRISTLGLDLPISDGVESADFIGMLRAETAANDRKYKSTHA